MTSRIESLLRSRENLYRSMVEAAEAGKVDREQVERLAEINEELADLGVIPG
jgi:hypothetical protein